MTAKRGNLTRSEGLHKTSLEAAGGGAIAAPGDSKQIKEQHAGITRVGRRERGSSRASVKDCEIARRRTDEERKEEDEDEKGSGRR